MSNDLNNTQRKLIKEINYKSNIKCAIIIIIMLLVNVIILFSIISKQPKISYINSARLSVGFSEAALVDKKLKVEEEKVKEQLKTLKDSVKTLMNVMSKEYDNAKPARKRELQDLLEAANKRVGNFTYANRKRLEKLRKEKMTDVINKLNVYIAEYGKKNKYSIILATTTVGNLVYGDTEKFDITDEIIAGLNERYK